MSKRLKSAVLLASFCTLLATTNISRPTPLTPSEYSSIKTEDSSNLSSTPKVDENVAMDNLVQNSEAKSANSNVSDNKTLDKPLSKSTTTTSSSRGVNTVTQKKTSNTPKSVTVKPTTNQKQNKTTDTDTIATSIGLKITKSERDLFARLVSAEAAGESFDGKLAVATVIINRVKSNIFANTITGVIYGKEGGFYQFTPVLDGRINESATLDSLKAVDMVLNGHMSFDSKVMWFLNPRKSSSSWITSNKTFYKAIENHEFYY